MEREEIHLYDPGTLAFYNINTPEQLQEAERIARDNLVPGNRE